MTVREISILQAKELLGSSFDLNNIECNGPISFSGFFSTVSERTVLAQRVSEELNESKQVIIWLHHLFCLPDAYIESFLSRHSVLRAYAFDEQPLLLIDHFDGLELFSVIFPLMMLDWGWVLVADKGKSILLVDEGGGVSARGFSSASMDVR